MKVTNNILPMMYVTGILAGTMNLISLADVPVLKCTVERDANGNPINTIGRIQLNKPARTTAFITSLAMICGYGFLAIKSVKGERLDDPEKILLAPTNQPVVDLGQQPDIEYVPADFAQQQQPMAISLIKTPDATTTKKPVRNIVQEIASSHQSTVIVSEPGCGKSTLEKAVLATVLRTFENVDIYIAGKKNDSWLGLTQNSQRFCFVTKETLPDFVGMMETIQDELTRRLGTPESERDFNAQPLVLLLDDWHALCKGLTKENKEKVTNILGEILTTGREVFVVAHVLTQSFNVTSLGLDDANIRGSMNLIALMKSNTNENGRNDGGSGTATRMINNPSIIGDNNQRQALLDQLPKLVKETEKSGLPAMVCLMGVNPFLGMLPDLNWVKGFTVDVIPTRSEVSEPEPEPDTATNTVVDILNRTLALDVAEPETNIMDGISDKELHIKCQRYASQGKSMYWVIVNVLNKPSGGRAFTDAQNRIKAIETRYGKINFPNKNNN